MLKTANKEMKTLLFNLNKVMNNGEETHKQISEHQTLEIDIFEGITFSMKVYLHDRNPPGQLSFNYMGTRDLLVYISRTCKQPSEENNQGKYHNVR